LEPREGEAWLREGVCAVNIDVATTATTITMITTTAPPPLKVMEDYAFCQYPTGERDKVEMKIDVLRMFNTIVWVDFWVAFLYYPVQAFDAFGGVALDEVSGRFFKV
jgi:hypothetical protein